MFRKPEGIYMVELESTDKREYLGLISCINDSEWGGSELN